MTINQQRGPMKNMVALCAIAAFLSGNIVALAAAKTILQKGKVFSETEVVIAKGDTLNFVNNDTVTHNVMSKSPGNEFNIGAQPPGASAPVTFDAVGTASIICAIHPQMRMNVTITN
jgi:plastocyanin